MKRVAHLTEGCGLALVVLFGLAVFGTVMAFRSFLSGLPWFMSEADKANAHIQAQQALTAAANASTWDPWTTGMKEFAVVSFWAAIGLLALGGSVGFLYARWRRERWVWARDGILPIRARQLEPEHALETIGAHHMAEIKNASRPLPPAHMHVTGKVDAVEAAPKEDDHHESPSFAEFMARGEFAANGG